MLNLWYYLVQNKCVYNYVNGLFVPLNIIIIVIKPQIS